MKKILSGLLKKYKWTIIIELICIILNVYLFAYPSKILGRMIDLLYNSWTNNTEIFKLAIMLLIICLITLGLRLVWKNSDFKLESQMTKDMKDKLFAKLLKSRTQSIGNIKNGEIMSYFVRDVKTIARITTKVISTGTRILSNFIIIAFMMSSSCNLKLTIYALLPIIITIIIVVAIRNKLGKSFQKAQYDFTDLSEYVQESTDSVRTMKAFVGEESQISDFIIKNKKLKTSNLEVTRNQNLLDICINIGFGLSYAISLLYGSKLVISQEITIGDLVAFNGYLAILEMPVIWIPWLVSRYKKFKVSYDRLNKMFNLPEEKIEINNINKTDSLKGTIEFKDLTFNYPGCLETVLENININVKQGESLGIIGVIGSGKTTLMNLLLKLYEVERGKLLIDGQDINDIPTEKIRKSICYITQDNFLFSATLKENINLFKDEYKDSEIEQSTQQAMIYDDISEMEQGINTIIGEKGIDLSGGQKQRVVISRAFLSNSNIVIFDDTFSALDNRTEQHVLTNIKELTKDKTCIIISNRISDIKHCDKIIVLEQGKIVESGIHKNLIKKQGEYYNFYRNQAHKTETTILA